MSKDLVEFERKWAAVGLPKFIYLESSIWHEKDGGDGEPFAGILHTEYPRFVIDLGEPERGGFAVMRGLDSEVWIQAN